MSAWQRRRFLTWGAGLGLGSVMPIGLGKPLMDMGTLIVELDLSTTSRDVGRAIELGINSALRESQAKLAIHVINTQGNLTRALDQLRASIQDPRILAMIGGGDSNLAGRIAEWATTEQLPYGITWASDASSEEQGPWIFRYCLSDAQCLEQLMGKTPANEKKRWGILLSNDPLGRASYEAILALLATPKAPELVGVQWHDVHAHDLSEQYTRLVALGAQAFWFCGHPRATRILAQTMHQGTHSVPVFTSPNAWSTHFASLRKPNLASLPIYFALPQPSARNPWSDRYQPLWTHPASAQAYRLTQALIQAVQHEVPATVAPKRQQIARAWRGLQETLLPLEMGFYHYDTLGRLERILQPSQA